MPHQLEETIKIDIKNRPKEDPNPHIPATKETIFV